MHYKYVTESLCDLWKTYSFYCQNNNYSYWKNIINNMCQYVNVTESHLTHVFYGIHALTEWARPWRGSHINSNIFYENTLFSQQKLCKSNKNITEHKQNILNRPNYQYCKMFPTPPYPDFVSTMSLTSFLP